MARRDKRRENDRVTTTGVLPIIIGDKSIRIHSTKDFTEKSFSPLLANKYGVNYVTYDSQGELVASASTDGTAHLWRIDENGAKVVCVFRHPDSTTVQVCNFSPDSNMLVTGCSDGAITVWSVEKKKKLFQIAGHPEGNVSSACFTPCNNYLVTGSAVGDVRVWDLRYSGEFCITQTQAHDKGTSGCGVDCICFSPTFHVISEGVMAENFLMASCGQDNQIQLWLFKRELAFEAAKKKDITDRCIQTLHQLSGHHGPVSQCCFSNDGVKMASSSFDKTVILWNPITSEQLLVLDGHSAIVTCVRFSVDGNYLASTSYDKTTIIWKLSSDGDSQNNALTNGMSQLASTFEQPKVEIKALNLWTTSEVINWLEEDLKLTQYSAAFTENEIDGAELVDLTADVLLEHLSVTPLGHRNKIIRGIKALQEKERRITASTSVQNGNPKILPTGADNPLCGLAYVEPTVRRNVNRTVRDDCNVPDEYLCPISREIMMDPVIAADGFSYERSDVEAWFKSGGMLSPMTNAKLTTRNLVPNQALKALIIHFIENNKT